MSRARGYAGMSKLRKLLNKMEPDTRGLVSDVIEDGAQAIRADMMIGAPVDDGDLVRSISYKLGRNGLSAYIGPGADRASIAKRGFGQSQRRYTKGGSLTSATLKDDHARLQLYKAHWYEHGTKPVLRILGQISEINETPLAVTTGHVASVRVERAYTVREPDNLTFKGHVTLRIITQHGE